MGGTFTISNLGMFGVEMFSAIINPPQGAILSVATPRTRVVLGEGGRPAGKTFTTMGLSADARAVGGDAAGQFLEALRANLENPQKLFL